ncbi:MAG: hypothetical protein ABI910_15335, partial [Gemmatimonadota bacterium]
MSTATVLAGVFTVAPVLERVHRGVASTVDDRWDVKICERQDSDPTIERPGNVSLTVFGPGVAAVRRPSLFSLDEWRSDTVDFYDSGRRVSLRFPPNGERTARLS